jgi:hypothetical protein
VIQAVIGELQDDMGTHSKNAQAQVEEVKGRMISRKK